jgi:hypothetical protein
VVETVLYKPGCRGFDSRWCHWNRIMALESTQPLTEMSTRNISWRCKGGLCVGLTTLPPSRAVLKSGSHNLLEPCARTNLPLSHMETQSLLRSISILSTSLCLGLHRPNQQTFQRHKIHSPPPPPTETIHHTSSNTCPFAVGPQTVTHFTLTF